MFLSGLAVDYGVQRLSGSILKVFLLLSLLYLTAHEYLFKLRIIEFRGYYKNWCSFRTALTA